jgi:hypothetical protein
MTQAGPRGWTPSTISHRYFSNGAPQSYDATSHSCEACISTGAAVQRVFGTEVLKISRNACDLSRVPVPLLDSHSQASIDSVIGKVGEVWIDGGKLQSRITFAQTPRGRVVEGMIARNELSALSCGYSVSEWSAVDSDGDPVDPSRAGWDDGLVFTAERWTLLEASVVGVGADSGALVRSLRSHADYIRNDYVRNCRARMFARQAMHEAVKVMERNGRR